MRFCTGLLQLPTRVYTGVLAPVVVVRLDCDLNDERDTVVEAILSLLMSVMLVPHHH
jgi:hypothetical protein